MAEIIDFFRAVHEIQRPRSHPLNNYDVHFRDPAGRRSVWNMNAASEEAVAEAFHTAAGPGYFIIYVRLVGYAKGEDG